MPEVAPVRMAAVGLNHNHIYGMAHSLLQAGAQLTAVHAPEADLLQAFVQAFPQAQPVPEAEAVFEDPTIDLILTAAIPSERADIAIRAMTHGKDVLSDKAGMTTLEQWHRVKETQETTGRIYAIAYSERIASRSTTRALALVRAGAIGQVVHLIGLGPHSLRKESRPAWFFHQATSGGILCDIAAHQFDQFLAFSQEVEPTIVHAQVANRANPETPEFEDFGDVVIQGQHCSGYIRVDWFTPGGLASWGDTRLTVLGTEGYMEVRKNVDIGGRPGGDHLFLVNQQDTQYIDCSQVELPFAPAFLKDIHYRTETAMGQDHCFRAMRLALEAQAIANA